MTNNGYNVTGLTAEQAKELQEKFGKNILVPKKKEGFLAYMFKCSIGNVTGALQDSVSLFHNKKE